MTIENKINTVVTNIGVSTIFLGNVSDKLESLSDAVKTDIKQATEEEIVLAYYELKQEIDLLKSLTFESITKLKQSSQLLDTI